MSWITIDLVVFFFPHLQLNVEEYISTDKVATEAIGLRRPAHLAVWLHWRLQKKKRLYDEDSGIKSSTAACLYNIYGQPDLTHDIIRIAVMTFNAS